MMKPDDVNDDDDDDDGILSSLFMGRERLRNIYCLGFVSNF